MGRARAADLRRMQARCDARARHPEMQTMTASIAVLAIRRLHGTGTVKAFCDLQLGGVKIMGAKIVQQDGKRAWIAMPAVKGSHGWTNTVELSQPLRQRVTEVVLAAWATHEPQQQDRPPDQRAAPWTERPTIETTPIPPHGDDLPF
jgi:DNA-binding cell septation regulator SpoVG